jgi:hypothetical protein
MMRYTITAVKSTTVVEWEQARFSVVAQSETDATAVADNMLNLEEEGRDDVVDANGVPVQWEEISSDIENYSPYSITKVETDWSDRPLIEGLGDAEMVERLSRLP